MAGSWWWWLDELNMALLAVTLAASLRWGAGPERLCAAVIVGMQGADAVLHAVADRGAVYHSVDAGHLAIDVSAALAFLVIAVNANRIYPLWIAALQLISVLAHFARQASETIAELAYAYLAYGPFYLEILVALGGIALHARRVRRTGTYRSWRTSSSPSPARTRKR